MASPTQWTWVWINSGSCWWTGRPGMLQSMESQRVWHYCATELNWTELNSFSIFGCKEDNQSDFSVDQLVMSMYRVICWIVWKECLLWPVFSLDKTLLAFALFPFVLQGQACLLFWVSLDFLLLHSHPLWWKGIFFDISSRRCFRSSENQSTSAPSASAICGTHLYCFNVEWFALEMNQDHPFVFETAPNYCILVFFVDSEGYPFLLEILTYSIRYNGHLN